MISFALYPLKGTNSRTTRMNPVPFAVVPRTFTPEFSRLALTTILGLASLINAGSRPAFAQQDCCSIPQHREYSLESLRGDYAAVATYGGNTARALGTQTLDGVGNLKGSAIVNQPGPDGTRTVVSITFTGTYSVNSDGTGIMSLVITLPNGTTANATENFVITKATRKDRVLIATEIIDAQEQPSTVIPGGVFVTHTYTRRPD
jgi:hypothetical protein